MFFFRCAMCCTTACCTRYYVLLQDRVAGWIGGEGASRRQQPLSIARRRPIARSPAVARPLSLSHRRHRRSGGLWPPSLLALHRPFARSPSFDRPPPLLYSRKTLSTTITVPTIRMPSGIVNIKPAMKRTNNVSIVYK